MRTSKRQRCGACFLLCLKLPFCFPVSFNQTWNVAQMCMWQKEKKNTADAFEYVFPWCSPNVCTQNYNPIKIVCQDIFVSFFSFDHLRRYLCETLRVCEYICKVEVDLCYLVFSWFYQLSIYHHGITSMYTNQEIVKKVIIFFSRGSRYMWWKGWIST